MSSKANRYQISVCIPQGTQSIRCPRLHAEKRETAHILFLKHFRTTGAFQVPFPSTVPALILTVFNLKMNGSKLMSLQVPMWLFKNCLAFSPALVSHTHL